MTPQSPEPNEGQGTGFDKDEFMRNVDLDGLYVHAERLSRDDHFSAPWKQWFASIARLARMLQEDGG